MQFSKGLKGQPQYFAKDRGKQEDRFKNRDSINFELFRHYCLAGTIVALGAQPHFSLAQHISNWLIKLYLGLYIENRSPIKKTLDIEGSAQALTSHMVVYPIAVYKKNGV